ncbi:MAG: carbohydrate-binding domain-containing protein [Oscillospiraceae bacterium]|nr:carbohydrate-binding domain-containing protein [Oscillospiraceae bacterium]
MKKRIVAYLLLIALVLSGCGESGTGDITLNGGTGNNGNTGNTGEVEEPGTSDVSEMDFSFTERELSAEATGGEQLKAGTQITRAGTYRISGNYSGTVVIDAGDNKVQLILDNANITAADGPAIYVKAADKVFLTLVGENILQDGKTYASGYTADNVDGAIFSRGDLAINGTGTLTVQAGYKHGIVSKDDLVITGGNILVEAPNVALSGKDCVKITSCVLNLTAGTDGIRSDNEEDASRGYVYIKDGMVTVTSDTDGIQAHTALKCDAPIVNITTTSGKGMKAGSDILIAGGSYHIQSQDDCVHSNNTIVISDGTLSLTSGDDGIHADTDLAVSGGDITITKSYEGMEASKLLISGGKMDITASDDGLNAAGGNDGSSMGGRPGQGFFSSSTGEISIGGGYLVINASGDGIDANGPITLSGGTVLVSGPTSGMNGAFDCDGTATVTGGYLIALGSNGMAQGFSAAENQGAALFSFSTQQGGTSFAVCDAQGNVVIAFTAEKTYASAAITAPGLQQGETYTVIVGGTVSNADENGFASSGTVSGGTTLGTFTMSSLIMGSSGGGPGGGGGRPPRP